MSTAIETFTARCDDCGAWTDLPPGGGPLNECCSLGDLRRVSVRKGAGEWMAHPNPRRDTVDGPPAFIWEMVSNDFRLYVNGQPVGEPVSHRVLVEMDSHEVVRLVNELLAAAHEVAAPEASQRA